MKKVFVLLTAAVLAVAFTVPAMAADWDFYGSSRVWTGWLDTSKEKSGLGVDDAGLLWNQQTNSRVGAKVKAGVIGGQFEYGHSSTADVRLLFGTWNFGAGTLLVGQDYTPIDTFWSSMNGPTGGDNCGISYGAPYSGRLDQLKLKIAGFEVALIENSGGTAAATGSGANDRDVTLPRMEANYMGKFGPVTIKPYVAYQTYEESVIAGTNETSYDVASYLLGLYAKVNVGPVEFAGNIYTGTNPGNYGLSQDIVLKNASFANNDVQDVDTLGMIGLVSFKVSDMIKLQTGYGYISNELDSAGTTTTETTTAFYVQATISPVKGVYIVPEIGFIDYGDREVTGSADTKLGDKTYYGAKWQINF